MKYDRLLTLSNKLSTPSVSYLNWSRRSGALWFLKTIMEISSGTLLKWWKLFGCYFWNEFEAQVSCLEGDSELVGLFSTFQKLKKIIKKRDWFLNMCGFHWTCDYLEFKKKLKYNECSTYKKILLEYPILKLPKIHKTSFDFKHSWSLFAFFRSTFNRCLDTYITIL